MPAACPEFRRCLALLVLLRLLAGCSPTILLNAATPEDTYALTADLAYGSLPRQRADLYRPRTAPPAGGYPLVVFFYGGNWRSGERADYRFVGEALAARGMLTLVVDYRLYPAVRYPEFLADGALAVRFAVDHLDDWGADPARLYLLGHSAGAYNAAMLALDGRWLAAQGVGPERLAGWGGLAGPYDFLPVRNPQTRPVFHFPDTPADSQPIRHVGPHRPPAFLAAARRDDVVDPVRNTGQLAAALQAAGNTVDLHLYDAVSHTTLIGAFARPLRTLAPVLDDFANFVGAGKAD
jgi:acetyl esterase/lipase